MNNFMITLFSLSLSATIVALFVMVINGLFKTALSKTWQYYIWLIVIARLLLPFTPEISIMNKLYEIASSETVIVTSESGTIVSIPDIQIARPASEANIVDSSISGAFSEEKMDDNAVTSFPENSVETLIGDILFRGWLIIACGLMCKIILNYFLYIHILKKDLQNIAQGLVADAYTAAGAQLGLKKLPELYFGSQTDTPMLIGFLKPRIILPVTIGVEPQHMQYILLHELVHYRRKDFLYKWLVQIAVCVHFFNPAVYYIRRRINRACEFSCDERVLGAIDEEYKKIYGTALIDTLETAVISRQSAASMTMSMMFNEDKSLIRQRLDAIRIYQKKPAVFVLLAAAVTLLIAAGSIFTGAIGTSGIEAETPELASTTLNQNISAINYEASHQQGPVMSTEKTKELFRVKGSEPVTQDIDNNYGGEVDIPSSVSGGSSKFFHLDEETEFYIDLKWTVVGSNAWFTIEEFDITQMGDPEYMETDRERLVYFSGLSVNRVEKINLPVGGYMATFGYRDMWQSEYNIVGFEHEPALQGGNIFDSNIVIQAYFHQGMTENSANGNNTIATYPSEGASPSVAIAFSGFSGSKTLYEFDVDEVLKLGFEIEGNTEQGDYKIAVINEEYGVVFSAVANNNNKASRPIYLPKGKNWIAAVGEGVTGNCTVTITPDYNYYDNLTPVEQAKLKQDIQGVEVMAEIRWYEESPHPYISREIYNNSNKTIAAVKTAYLGFDENGAPVPMTDYFQALNNETGSYELLWEDGPVVLAPGERLDTGGGWSLSPDSEIHYLLYCVYQVEYESGDVWADTWTNPYYTYWKEAYHGQTLNIADLGL